MKLLPWEGVQDDEMGVLLFREYCFGEENSLSLSAAQNSVSSLLHTQIIG